MAFGSGRMAVPGNRHIYLKLFVAVCCIGAVGLAATSYEASVETNPDEVIDAHHSWLPVGKETILFFKNPQERSLSGGGGGGSSDGGGSGDDPAECTGGVLGVLAMMFPMFIPPCGPFYLLGLLLAFLGMLLTVALAYRYRWHLIAPGIAVWGWLNDRGRGPGSGGPHNWPSEPPGNEIYGAWLDMVERADPEQPWSRSPAQCASAAVDAGMDSEAVGRLTTLFEEVRYGGADPTDERQQSARKWLQRLRGGRGGGDQQFDDGQPLADGQGPEEVSD